MTETTEAPATPAGAGTKPAKRTSCGFCATGDHWLCPGMIRNGSLAKVPVWTCLCSEKRHTLGKQPPLARREIIRMLPGALAGLRKPPVADGTDAPGSPAPARQQQGQGQGQGQVPPPGDQAGELHTHCERCGWDFGQPVAQARCGSQRMCDKRVELGDPAYGRRKAKP